MIRAGIITAVVFAQAGAAAAQRIEVPVTAFKFSGQGQYVWKRDRRDLFQMIHPWTTSKAGDFGQMEAEVTVPAEAKPPVTLVFYVMDNNYTGPENTGADWINRDVRVGHRFHRGEVVERGGAERLEDPRAVDATPGADDDLEQDVAEAEQAYLIQQATYSNTLQPDASTVAAARAVALDAARHRMSATPAAKTSRFIG